ncbi:LCP family protein [Romboutsia sp. CE17]|uniref:LCP family protein n=1 Tax=Romboutsia sp. CE17 TaxID=2724150 RepID=UPI001442B797|nr:LCP family protein [Romboutsia sp. CE17]QJA09344.1 LCP family protein [Romboutsia sp. CE17]
MSKLKKLVIFLAILVIALPASAFGYVYYKLNSIHDSSINTEALSDIKYEGKNGVTNILLVGTDGRPGEESSRSDSMMILTVDDVNKSLKLTSLARDSYVDIPGHGYQKLTHAYAYGQANLLIETIEDNFEIDIHNYVVVDFYSFMDIVDSLGGVTVTVQESELEEVNKFIPETYKWDDNPEKGDIQYIESAGKQKLNGYQALSFSRIRKNDSAMERDRRQREVIQGLLSSVKSLPISKYPGLIDTVLPYVKTNMKPSQILGLGSTVLSLGNINIKQIEFPIDDDIHSKGGKYGDAGWVLRFEKDTLPLLHDFIYNDILPKDNDKF